MTGWAQINWRDELQIPVKVEFDGCSLERHSFLLDLKSIALTFVKVVKKEGITH